MVIVVMGVAGAGKTTVGRALAERIGGRFLDADDLHSAENLTKLHAGHALTDADRAPWLAALRRWIDGQLAAETDAVLACSALKASYRDTLRVDERVHFVWLDASPELLRDRLAARTGHVFNPDLLPSQLATLEPPADALPLDADQPPATLVAEIVRRLRPSIDGNP